MTRDQLRSELLRLIVEVLEDRGEDVPEIDDATVLLGSGLGIDSLDLAGIVVGLEGYTGQDPFRGGFVHFTTVGGLLALYTTDEQPA